jgi:hypothetical protein
MLLSDVVGKDGRIWVKPELGTSRTGSTFSCKSQSDH